MINIVSIFLNNFRHWFSTLANPNTEIGSARNRSFYLQANQKPKIETYLKFRMKVLPSGLRIKKLPSWLRIEKMASWLRIKNLPSWLRIEKLPSWLRIKKLPSWLRIEKLPSWLRIEKLPSWLRIFKKLKFKNSSIRSQCNHFVIRHRLDLIILTIFVIFLASSVLASWLFTDPDFVLVHAWFRKSSREKIPHRGRPNKGLSRGSRPELLVKFIIQLFQVSF